ncbi:hypothetical protein [Halarcobacter sp.]|uniref:hypothetical protein n=1 Tax=Halarcobacter sp. TaxID=2321133 RepID=UPI002AA68730|nr:hypothetical protein [Halarcobacter sp.]
MLEDFNKEFWNIWGIVGNRRIYTHEDVFRIKSSWRESIKRNFFKFLNKEKISNRTFIQILYNEPNTFYLLFENLLNNQKNNLFYVKELNNISFSFKFCQIFNVYDNNTIIDLISFQIAYIVEHMKTTKIDVKLFDETIKTKSLIHYIEQLKIKKNKNTYGIARELSLIHNNLLRDIKKRGYKTAIKEMKEDESFGSTFEKDISTWKKGKLPGFFKLLVLSVALFENYPKEERFASFLLLLIARGLLYIKDSYKINVDIENRFIKKYSFFREELSSLFKDKSFDEIDRLQKKYCISFEKIFGELDTEITINMNDLMKNIYPFFQNKIDALNINDSMQDKMNDFVKSENIKFHY